MIKWLQMKVACLFLILEVSFCFSGLEARVFTTNPYATQACADQLAHLVVNGFKARDLTQVFQGVLASTPKGRDLPLESDSAKAQQVFRDHLELLRIALEDLVKKLPEDLAPYVLETARDLEQKWSLLQANVHRRYASNTVEELNLAVIRHFFGTLGELEGVLFFGNHLRGLHIRSDPKKCPTSTGSSCNTSRKSQTLSKVLSERIRIEYEAAGRLPRAENQRRFEALKLEFPELLRRSDFDRLEHVIGALADVEFDMLVEPIRRDGVLNSQATFGLVEVKTSDHRISRSDLFTPQPNVGAMINSFKRLVAFREILRLQNEIQLIAFFPHGIETDAAAELETLGFVVIDGRPFTRQLETHKP